ncbi:MAG: alpha-L-fucosidase [Dermatophilaceae bacterium]
MTPRAEHRWFTHDRFGMFVHWGLYALAARHEWVSFREQIPPERYERYADHFTADRFDPDAWAALAKAAGMRYAVLTTKHHDGFCLWPSDLTDYSVARTPYGQDAVGAFVTALRSAGLRVGFYHSLLDWHHPDFPVDSLHPLREGNWDELNAGRDIGRYREYLHGQIRELLTRYGTIDYLWFDFSYPHLPGGKGPADWGSADLLALVRELQPGIIVNERLGIPGDLVSPEQYQPSRQPTRDGEPLMWDACQTVNGSWGYDRDGWGGPVRTSRDQLQPKSVELLIRMLVDGVSKNGNLMLNVGPDGRGEIDAVSRRTLTEIGAWMELNEAAIRGAGASELTPPPDCRYTARGDRLYVHIFAWPFKHLHLPGLDGKVGYAQFLHDASEVTFHDSATAEHAALMLADRPEGALTLDLPVPKPDVAVPVIELFLTW